MDKIDIGSIVEIAAPIVGTAAVLLFIGAVSMQIINFVSQHMRSCLGNEWMVVLRNGEMSKCGIGLTTFVWPGDNIVVFPSTIHQVNFTAQQVTSEMQGVEVKGMLVWSVYRNEDGPLKCYKSFGDDLKQEPPRVANEKLENMAIAIIRDRIANMTIEDILRNRSRLRMGAKEEIQKLLTGWGMWLETIEIQDVKIASQSLFKNMQTDFREKTRHSSETIQAIIGNQIQEEAMVRNAELDEERTKSRTEAQFFVSEQDIKVKEITGKLYQQQVEIEIKKQEANNDSNAVKEKNQLNLDSNQMKLNASQKVLQNTINIQECKYEANLANIQNQTNTIEAKFDAELEQKRKDQEYANLESELKMQTKYYKPNVLKDMLLDSTKKIYENLYIQNLSVTNVSGMDSSESSSNVLAQAIAGYKAMDKAITLK